jgi:hypothetical protein
MKSIDAAFVVTGLPKLILQLILNLVLVFTIFRLFLEVIERWILLNLLYLSAPLALAMAPSSSTSGITRKFVSSYLSQATIMLLNVWIVEAAMIMLRNLGKGKETYREMTGWNLKVANGDRTMNRAAGFEASWPTSPTEADCAMPAELKAVLDDNNYSTKAAIALHDDTDAMPTTGKKSGMMLIDLRGRDYDDPLWDTYIQQWKPAEMALLLGKAGFALTRSSKSDLVVQYFIQRGEYSIVTINTALYDCDLPLLTK